MQAVDWNLLELPLGQSVISYVGCEFGEEVLHSKYAINYKQSQYDSVIPLLEEGGICDCRTLT